MVSSKKC